MRKKKIETGDGLVFHNAQKLSGVTIADITEGKNGDAISMGTLYRLFGKHEFDDDEKSAAAAALGKSVAEIFGVNPEKKDAKGDEPKKHDEGQARTTPHEKPKKKVPLIGVAAASTDLEINVHDSTGEMEYIDVGDMLRDSEAAFTVYGNSMNPNYPSGCILGIRRNYDNFIQPGEIYLLVTRSNRLFKRLYYNDDKTGFVCHSDNTMEHDKGSMKGKAYYPPFEVKGSDVISIYDVVGMIKRTRNSNVILRQA